MSAFLTKSAQSSQLRPRDSATTAVSQLQNRRCALQCHCSLHMLRGGQCHRYSECSEAELHICSTAQYTGVHTVLAQSLAPVLNWGRGPQPCASSLFMHQELQSPVLLLIDCTHGTSTASCTVDHCINTVAHVGQAVVRCYALQLLQKAQTQTASAGSGQGALEKSSVG